LKKNERKFLIEEKNSINFSRTLFEPFSLSLVGPLSHHDDSENYFYSQTRRDEKKALLLFLLSLFLCVLVEVVSRFI